MSDSPVPKPWRSPWALAQFAGAIVTAAAVAMLAVRTEAERVVEEKWNEKQRAEVIAIASEAAKAGAQAAIAEELRSLIMPLQVAQVGHERMDDVRVEQLQRDVARVDARLDRLEQRAGRR